MDNQERVRLKEKEEKSRMKGYGMQKPSAYEESVMKDPNRISKYNAFMQGMSYQKLKQKKILISESLAYRRPSYKMS